MWDSFKLSLSRMKMFHIYSNRYNLCQGFAYVSIKTYGGYKDMAKKLKARLRGLPLQICGQREPGRGITQPSLSLLYYEGCTFGLVPSLHAPSKRFIIMIISDEVLALPPVSSLGFLSIYVASSRTFSCRFQQMFVPFSSPSCNFPIK